MKRVRSKSEMRLVACTGRLLNPMGCEGPVASNKRLCGACHKFAVRSEQMLVCSQYGTPFTLRKRRYMIEARPVEARAFRCDRAARSCNSFAPRDDEHLLVVFGNVEDAMDAAQLWPHAFRTYAEASGDTSSVLEFSECPFCNRKPFPSQLVICCTNPSCLKKAREKGWGLPDSELYHECDAQEFGMTSSPSTGLPTIREFGERDDKRRRQWRIVPDRWVVPASNDFSNSKEPPRAVIQCPEELCAQSLQVTFGSHYLKEREYICGLREVIILSIPQSDLLSIGEIKVCVTVNDGKGVLGSMQFTYDYSELNSALNYPFLNQRNDFKDITSHYRREEALRLQSTSTDEAGEPIDEAVFSDDIDTLEHPGSFDHPGFNPLHDTSFVGEFDQLLSQGLGPLCIEHESAIFPS